MGRVGERVLEWARGAVARDLDLRRSGRDLGGISIWARFDLCGVTSSSWAWMPGMMMTGMHPWMTGSSMWPHPLPGSTAQKVDRCSTCSGGGGRAGGGACSGVCVEYWGVTRGVTRGVT